MLEEMVKNVVKKSIATDFPHLKLPAVIFATVASVKKLDTFDEVDLIIHNDDTGTSFHGHITHNWFEYVLNVVDRFGNPDDEYPTLPQIKSKMQFEAGAIVVVGLPYGDLTPTIIGEVKL